MPEVDLVQVLEDWYESNRDSAAARGLAMRFGRTSEERAKTSGWLAAERSGRMANLEVWSSGEVELEAGGHDRVDVQEHHEIAHASELEVLLDRLLTFIEMTEQ
jgi:hypothetical protein